VADQPSLILVVDDHEAGRFAKSRILRQAGFRVSEASTGHDALDLTRVTSPDAILLDVNLPDLNGFEVCRRIRTDHGAPIQILQISATARTDSDRVRGLDAGADAYLTEPVSPEVLVATLRALLRVQAAERERSAALAREAEARRAADEANRIKDDFLATLSHELRTPLNAVMGWLWQLRRSPLDERIRERALESMERSVKLQMQLVNDLLDVSRAGRGKLELSREDVELHVVLAAAAEDIRQETVRAHIDLDLALQPIRLNADPARLQQIFGNLLGNAVRYTPEHGAIALTSEVDGGDAVVSVRDTGAGIDPDLLPFIFDRFRQSADAATQGHRGLGLGLTIVRQLVELHGGRIAARSAGIGQGSTFEVRLPGARPVR
jgi:signal transduction histidine kinase